MEGDCTHKPSQKWILHTSRAETGFFENDYKEPYHACLDRASPILLSLILTATSIDPDSYQY